MKLNQLMTLIEMHTAISFDVYDTLIMRKTLHPYDVFKLVGELYCSNLKFDFFIERRRAEIELRAYTDPNIYEIYSQMQSNIGFSDKIMQELLNTEIAIEIETAIPRQCVVDIFNKAVKDKRVFLISDMHLPSATIKNILHNFGIDGYEELILSNEQRTCKKKYLYEKYQERTYSESCLHIGDNYKTDYLRPRDFGIDTFWIPSAYDYFKSKNPDFIEPTSLDVRLKANERIIKEYQNPFE